MKMLLVLLMLSFSAWASAQSVAVTLAIYPDSCAEFYGNDWAAEIFKNGKLIKVLKTNTEIPRFKYSFVAKVNDSFQVKLIEEDMFWSDRIDLGTHLIGKYMTKQPFYNDEAFGQSGCLVINTEPTK